MPFKWCFAGVPMLAGLVALWFFRGSGLVLLNCLGLRSHLTYPSIAKKPYISVIFQEGGGSRPPLTPLWGGPCVGSVLCFFLSCTVKPVLSGHSERRPKKGFYDWFLYFCSNINMPGRVAQSVTCLATDACLTAYPGVASSIPVRSHTFVEIDHEMISTVILLPSADSFKKGCCQLQAKVCAQITG